MTTITENTIHAAETWLERLGAGPAAVAVITIKPRAVVGIWEPGSGNVATLARIDDAAAELCEAVAPAVEEALDQLDEDQRVGIMEKVAMGMPLQALVAPAMGGFSVRLIRRDGVPVEVASLMREGLEN